ncbi:MAG: DMT family transporter [Bacillota bacterium]
MLVYYVLAFGIGAIWALQPVINAGLAKSVGVFMASAISFGIGFLFLVAAVVVAQIFGEGTGNFSAASQINIVYFLGGVIGALVVLGMLFIVPKFGAGIALSAAITGQLIMAALIDQFGLFGAPRIIMSPSRLLGIVLLLLGVNLVIKK